MIQATDGACLPSLCSPSPVCLSLSLPRTLVLQPRVQHDTAIRALYLTLCVRFSAGFYGGAWSTKLLSTSDTGSPCWYRQRKRMEYIRSLARALMLRAAVCARSLRASLCAPLPSCVASHGLHDGVHARRAVGSCVRAICMIYQELGGEINNFRKGAIIDFITGTQMKMFR